MAEAAGQTFDIDWGLVGAIIALIGIVVGAAITLVFYQHGQLLAQLKDEKDRIHMRERLVGDGGIAKRFRDGVDGLITRIDGYFGPRLGFRAFDRCLMHAHLYPILLFIAAWVAGADGALGTIRLLTDGGTWLRLWAFAALVLALGLFFFIIVNSRRIESLLWSGIWKILYLVSTTLSRSAPWIERPKAAMVADTQAVANRVFGPFVLIVTATVTGAIAVVGAAAFGVAGADTGVHSIAFPITVIFIFATVSLIGTVLVVIFAYLPKNTVLRAVIFTVITVGTLIFSFTIVYEFGAATGSELVFALAIVTFYAILPLPNAILDWVSWAWTRLLLRRPADGEGATRSATVIAARLLVDLGLAFVSLCLLALLLPNVIEGANQLYFWLELPTIAWLPLLNEALEAPFTQGLFVTGMLLTTLLPTLIHVTAGLFGVFAVWSGGGPTMATHIPVEATEHMAESDRQTVAWFLLRRRLWLIPAIIATVLLIVPPAWLLSFFIGPIGLFLADLALCSTSWSHGLCPFMD